MAETVLQTLQDAVAALNAATNSVIAQAAANAQAANASQTAATTVINNFLARPSVQTVYLDPQNGNDTLNGQANPGTAIATPMKTIEAIINAAGTAATKIILLNDLLIQTKTAVNCALQIVGAQPSSTGYAAIERTVSFLGTATNSPDLFDNWTFCSGLFLGGASFSTSGINFALPSQVAGQTFSGHLLTQVGTTISLFNGTLTVADQTSGQLVETVNSKSNVFSNLVLGAGAAGHLFQGVAAGANPNSQWVYDSNVTSA